MYRQASVLADSAAEQGPVRQRELQVIGDQDGIEWLAVGVQPVGDHTDRLH